jgi:hypothetical protein
VISASVAAIAVDRRSHGQCSFEEFGRKSLCRDGILLLQMSRGQEYYDVSEVHIEQEWLDYGCEAI